MSNLGQRIYRGEVSYDFVGKWRRWAVISGVILLVSIGTLVFRGLSLGIEFKGGADFAIPNATCSIEEARASGEAQVGGEVIVTETASGTVRVQTPPVSPEESAVIAQGLAEICGVSPDQVTSQVVGPTWGSEISVKALQGLVVFLVLVTIFLVIYFEWQMAVAALVALAHDLIITVGVYALLGLQVTPATVIGLLTILGYSLYDTVVIFDQVKEKTRGIAGQSVMTYDEAVNLAVNQTVVRSINTSLTSILPVISIIVVGAGFLGAGTLLDLAVALAIGMVVGTFSSIFIAPPLLALLRGREPEMKSLAARVAARRKQAAAKASDALGPDGTDTISVATPDVVSTRVDSMERNQPRRQARSKRRR